MKTILLVLFPMCLFAQVKTDTINDDVKSALLKSYYQMNSLVKKRAIICAVR